jgi:hypothetical protein
MLLINVKEEHDSKTQTVGNTVLKIFALNHIWPGMTEESARKL